MTMPRDHEDSGRMRYGGEVLREKDALGQGDLVAAGKYRIEGVLGRGGMAIVYSAVRQHDGLPVAIKVMKGKYARRSDIEYRMRNEVNLAAELSGHPNLVRPLDTGRLAECEDAPYLATELIHGPPLSLVVIMERPMPALRVSTIALEIARALVALHERGIVHRDVKPDNVMMVTEGDREVVKLIDFGLASRIQAPHATSARVTEVFERPGTKHYMAPEQAMGKPAAPAMDVYALGCTMYEMLLGSPPYGQRSEDEVMARKLATDEPGFSITGERRDLPASLEALVDACLVREPGLRIALPALCEGLEKVLGDLGGASTSATAAARPTRPSDSGDPDRTDVQAAANVRVPAARGRWHLWAALAALVVLTFAGFSWWRASVEHRVVELEPTTSDEAEAVPSAGVAAPSKDQVGPTQPEVPQPVPVPEVPPAIPSPSVESPSTDAVPAADVGDDAVRVPPRKDPAVVRETPPKDDAACKALRAEVDSAVRALAWYEVLDKTASKRCWPASAERLRARLQALLAVGRYDQCAREGKASTDDRAARITGLCQRKLNTP